MTNTSEPLAYMHKNQDRYLAELKELIKIPSISTNPENKQDIENTAHWIADQLNALGMENVKIYTTAGHPVVFGEYLNAGSDKPTILIYGHYDVQPPEPLELWETPPFEPTQRGENLYGRGASDMKGQVIASLKSVEAYTQTGELPINIKFIIEGEEEIGSPSLGDFIAEHKELLACDFALNPDAGMLGAEYPTITYGLRGLAYFEINIQGPQHDLHSGEFGGAVKNPAQALCELIAKMHDIDGRITLPDFYNSVIPVSEKERAELARIPQNDEFFLDVTGAPALFGEKGYSSLERVSIRPTLEVNGMISGFTGKGSKTVLPAKAMAKISMRLVPNQDPEEVHQQLITFFEQNAPPTITWEITQLAGGRASITDRNIPGVKALDKALKIVWGKPAYYQRMGGSIPVVAQMKDILNIESVMSGFGLPDDNIHAPNEKLHLPTWYKGIEAFIYYFDLLANL